MFRQLKSKFETKRSVLAKETRDRIAHYAYEAERRSLLKMKKNEENSILLSTEIEKYLQTTNPVILLKVESSRALLNLLYARSEGTFSVNLSMSKDMRKVLQFYQRDLKVFLNVLEELNFTLAGNEELFLTMVVQAVRQKNFDKKVNQYSLYVTSDEVLEDVISRYFEVIHQSDVFETGHVDYLRMLLNDKNLYSNKEWTVSTLSKALRQFEKKNYEEIQMRKLKSKLREIS